MSKPEEEEITTLFHVYADRQQSKIAITLYFTTAGARHVVFE